MVIIRNISEVKYDKNTVITLGTFDGFHLGHKQIIRNVVEKTLYYKGRNFLITFNPHPRKVVSVNNNIRILSTLDEKIEILKNLLIDNLFVINFTKEFSEQSPEYFVTKYLVESIGVKEIVIGYDHHFGKGRGGDISLLGSLGEKFDFKVTPVDEYEIDGETVSSTKIRNALAAGDILKANKMLGRYYSFSGRVVKGDGRGRKLGYPTANLKIEDTDKLLPSVGIYVIECCVDNKKFFGLLSIGSKPTFTSAGEIIPEVYIFDFNEDIYDKLLHVNLIELLRGEEKFNSAEELIKQMDKDKQAGLKIIQNLTN
jgi:riboflavin kinase/FMN adenylyltransferase